MTRPNPTALNDHATEQATDHATEGRSPEPTAGVGEIASSPTAGFSNDDILELVPCGEPKCIHEIAGQLLGPYRVRGGHVQLAGCTLDARATLRLGFLAADATVATAPGTRTAAADELHYYYFGPDGCQLAAQDVARGGLGEVQSMERRLRKADREVMEAWVDVAEAGLRGDSRFAVEGAQSPGRLSEVAVIWSYWAAGKIVFRFTSGVSAQLQFAGWSRDFSAGLQQPPKYRCPRSGRESFHCLALADGTVTVAEAVAVCELSGRELMLDELTRCEVSGRLIAVDQGVVCAVTGRVGSRDRMSQCQWCQAAVVPGVIREGVCQHCRSMKPLQESLSTREVGGLSGGAIVDQPWCQLFAEQQPEIFQRLGAPRKWLGWSSEEAVVIQGGSLSERTFVVVRRSDGLLLRLGTRRRWSSQWTWKDGG